MLRVGLVTLLLASLPVAAGEEIPSLPEVLQRDFRVTTLDGETVPLATLLEPGRPTVVEFWATWCAPCRQSMPHLVELKDEYGDRLVVIGLTVEDPESDRDKVRRFAEEQRMSFPIAFAPDKLFQLMNDRADIAVPKLFVFDGDGALVRYIPRHSASTARKLRQAVADVVH